MIVVFDAECPLCCGSVQFLLRHDRRHALRFATIQNESGQRLLEDAGIDALAPDTFLLVDGGRRYTQSRALIEVLHALGWRWRIAWALWLVPAPLRDAAYRSIARHRYRWFGRRATCWLPEPDHATRFLR